MCIQRYNNKHQGFTLIEILLALALTTTMLVTMVFFAQRINEAQIKQRSIKEVQEQGDTMLLYLLDLIHNAQDVITPAPGTSSNTLILQYDETTLNPTTINSNLGQVFIEQNNGGQVPLHNNTIEITNLQFINKGDSWDIIDISFNASYQSDSQRSEYVHEARFSGSSSIRRYVR